MIFSVNFHGLDKHGEAATVLRQHGVPVAVWCVDNPWNLLAGLRGDFWKEFHLFVTDASFIAGLTQHGAKSVTHLPLAADPALFGPAAVSHESALSPALKPVVFAGRSSFPDKERFFVGQSIPESLLERAKKETDAGRRPDFFWWLSELAGTRTPPTLWPGSAARKASLGAEETSLYWRTACLRSALPCGLTIYGDHGWAAQLGAGIENGARPDLRDPVDYYTRLPAIYRAAEFSLVTTSFLLPGGLNQRHFDVWCSGGFALLDATPGLALFPAELTRAVTYPQPGAIPAMVQWFTAHPTEKERLAKAWRHHILAEHTYAERIRSLLRRVFT